MAFIIFTICIIIIAAAFFAVVKVNIPENEKEYDYDPDYNKAVRRLRLILKFKPIVFMLIAIVVVIVGLCTSIYSISEQEIGFTTLFGKDTVIETAGIHFKLPFVSKKHIFDATTQGMPIGYTEETDESVTEDSLMITGDFNFLNIDFYVEYHITDPIAYYYSTSDPEGLLKNIALASIRNTVGSVDVDYAMTTGKSQIETDVFEDIKNELEKYHTGLTVTNISIQDSEPPTEKVQNAFQAVEDAKQGAKTAVNEANKYTNERIPDAEASAAKILTSAEATRTERVNQATEEVATFEALYSEYAKNPEIVKQRMYLDTLSGVLPKMKLIIGKDSKVVYITSSEDVSETDNSKTK